MAAFVNTGTPNVNILFPSTLGVAPLRYVTFSALEVGKGNETPRKDEPLKFKILANCSLPYPNSADRKSVV